MAENITNDQKQANATSRNPLADIIKKYTADGGVFNEYKAPEEVAVEIFEELNKRFVPPKYKENTEIIEKRGGFFMSDSSNRNNRDFGILPQCQSLQALVSLASDYGLDFNKPDIIKRQSGTIRQMMDDVIIDLIDRIIKTDEETGEKYCIFDASPYAESQFTREHSNIDAITWVVPSFFLILKYHAHIHEVCRFEDDLIFIITEGLKYLDEAFIEEIPEKANEKLTTGWNFTKDCEEPSLYFTFTVCECYLDMYNTFREALSYQEALRDNATFGFEIDEEILQKYEKAKADYEANKNKKTNRLRAKFDEYNELARIYNRINPVDRGEDWDPDAYPDIAIEGTLYGELEQKCKAVSEAVWRFVRKDLADKFFYNDLRTTLTEQEIRVSTTSDALFNTVYIINIMIDAGLDETLRKKYLTDTDSGINYQREYDNFLESCQLAVQKALRTYESLKNDSKEYIVDQFLIGFNENFEKRKDMANELRKLRMRTFSIVPLLIHTNNIMSEYLIKYPQYNMRRYLEYILENRYVDGSNKKCWIWERDGFFSGSNYYFILALSEFYSYYKDYEQRYIPIGSGNIDREREITAAYHASLLEETGEIGMLNKEIGEKKDEIAKKEEELKQKDEEIARLEKEKDEIKRPVEDAVRTVIDEELDARLTSLLVDRLTKASQVLTIPEVDETTDEDGSSLKLKDALLDMFLSSLLTSYFSNKIRKCKSKEDYFKLKNNIRADLAVLFNDYVASISTSEDGYSNLRKLLDKNA